MLKRSYGDGPNASSSYINEVVKRHTFKEGEFYIIPWGSDFPDSSLLVPSIICHVCPATLDYNDGGNPISPHIFWSDYQRLKSTCWVCKKPVPENVKTLWILQNSDHLDMS